MADVGVLLARQQKGTQTGIIVHMSTQALPRKINDVEARNAYEALFQAPLLTPMEQRAVEAR